MTRDEIIEFGQWVKQRRESSGFTQTELSEKLEISLGTLAPLEIGKARYVSDKMRHKIESFFSSGVAVHTLQTVRSTGVELLDPILARLARLVADPSFPETVKGATSLFKVNEEKAILMIFKHALNN